MKKPPPSKINFPGGFQHHHSSTKSGAKSSDVWSLCTFCEI